MALLSNIEPEPKSKQHWVAEEAADVVVETIVERGARTIERNNLERKAYPFAAKAAENAALSYVSMCYLPAAEEPQEEGEFDLEDEPMPESTDAWARMSIQPRPQEYKTHQNSPQLSSNASRRHRLQGAIFGSKSRGARGLLDRMGLPRSPGGQGGGSPNNSSSGQPQATSRPASANVLRATDFRQVVMMATHSGGGQSFTSASPSSPTSPNTTRLKASQARASPIVDDIKPSCEWEEKLRAEKAKKRQERQAQLARERRQVEEEAIKQAEWQRKIQDEALKGPCTYDNEGNVIWVEELNMEALPKPTYGLNYEVQEDLIIGADDPIHSQSGSRAGSKTRSNSKQRLRFALQKETKKKKKEHAFTDSFHRPVGWQPPLWENFTAKQGVVLECPDTVIRGPPNDGGVGMRMTRKQYEAFQQSGKRVPVGCDFSSWLDGMTQTHTSYASEAAKSDLHHTPHGETQVMDDRYLQPPSANDYGVASRPGTAPPSRGQSRRPTALGQGAGLDGHFNNTEGFRNELGAIGVPKEASVSGLPQALGHPFQQTLDGTALHFDATAGHFQGHFGATQNNFGSNINNNNNNHNNTSNHHNLTSSIHANITVDLGGRHNHAGIGRNFAQDVYLSKDSSSDQNGSSPNQSMTLARPATAPGTLCAPAAPGQSQRAKQFGGSIGHRPHPRSRMVLLGSTSNVGPAQPPLGACMGHGLLMTTANKADFYFPPEPHHGTPTQMQRASSASGLSMTKRSSLGSVGGGCATGQRSRPTSRCTNKSSHSHSNNSNNNKQNSGNSNSGTPSGKRFLRPSSAVALHPRR